MIRNLFVSVGLVGVGVLIGIFLPISPTNFNEPLIDYSWSWTYIDSKKVNNLQLEFRESMVVEKIEINDGNCEINPFDPNGWVKGEPLELPMFIGMGTVINPITDCGVFIRLFIQTDKGVLNEEFPEN